MRGASAFTPVPFTNLSACVPAHRALARGTSRGGRHGLAPAVRPSAGPRGGREEGRKGRSGGGALYEGRGAGAGGSEGHGGGGEGAQRQLRLAGTGLPLSPASAPRCGGAPVALRCTAVVGSCPAVASRPFVLRNEGGFLVSQSVWGGGLVVSRALLGSHPGWDRGTVSAVRGSGILPPSPCHGGKGPSGF